MGWLRGWAGELLREKQIKPDSLATLPSNFAVVKLPTAADMAAAAFNADSLPTGVRFRFLALGIEYVEEGEEERVKGDFDGAIDVLIEPRRVRVVRAEMQPVFRRGTDGSRIKVAPLVKVESEARLLRRL